MHLLYFSAASQGGGQHRQWEWGASTTPRPRHQCDWSGGGAARRWRRGGKEDSFFGEQLSASRSLILKSPPASQLCNRIFVISVADAESQEVESETHTPRGTFCWGRERSPKGSGDHSPPVIRWESRQRDPWLQEPAPCVYGNKSCWLVVEEK